MTACAIIYDTAPTAAKASLIARAYRAVCSEGRFSDLAGGRAWSIQVDQESGPSRLLLSSFFPPAGSALLATALRQAREQALLAEETAAIVPVHGPGRSVSDPFDSSPDPESFCVVGSGPPLLLTLLGEAEAECVRRAGAVSEATNDHGRTALEFVLSLGRTV